MPPFSRNLTLTLSLAIALPFGSLRAQEVISLPASDGSERRPLIVPSTKKGALIIFVSPYCNTSNTFLPEVNEIARDFDDEFSIQVVHAEPGLELTQVLEHKEVLKVEPVALLDARQQLVQALGAKVTPEAVVVSPSGETLYQGRINDLYLGPTKRQREATTSDLRDALQAVAAGQEVAVKSTEAMGCKISKPKS